MDDDDLLARVQLRGRLYGRNESRRAICAVVEALGEFLSARAFHLIADQLPDEVRRRLVKPSASVRAMTAPTCRSFLGRIGRQLFVDGPDAAFTARIVLEQLNATRRVITPAAFAHLVAPDLRPLLCARPFAEPVGDQLSPPRRLIRVPSTPTRPSRATFAAPPRRPVVPALPVPASLPAAATAAHPAAADRRPDRVVA